MNRITRRLAAIVAIAGLAFAQLAVSAYACPQGGSDPAFASATTAGDRGDMPDPNLCERHCNYGASSVDTQGFAPAAPAPAVLSFRVEPLISVTAPSTPTIRPFERRIERSPLILFGVLRI